MMFCGIDIGTTIDKYKANFAVIYFEFEPGEATLFNLNSTPHGQGQLITITGVITENRWPKGGL